MVTSIVEQFNVIRKEYELGDGLLFCIQSQLVLVNAQYMFLLRASTSFHFNIHVLRAVLGIQCVPMWMCFVNKTFPTNANIRTSKDIYDIQLEWFTVGDFYDFSRNSTGFEQYARDSIEQRFIRDS